MSPLRLNGSTSGYSQIDAPAVAGDQTFTLPGTGGTLDRLNRAGNILQVVQTAVTDTFSTTSTSYVDRTGLSASITPQSSSNKILVFVNIHAYNSGANTAPGEFIALIRGSTTVAEQVVSGTGTNRAVYISLKYLDAPNTTSSTTYKLQVKTEANGKFENIVGYTQTLILLEVVA